MREHNHVSENMWIRILTAAEDASRGLSAKDLIQSKRWIYGPSFLWNEEDRWPKQANVALKIEKDDPEIIKKDRKTSATATTGEDDPLDQMIQPCSSWYRLIIKTRVAVRSVITHCFGCRQRQAPGGTKTMAEHPAGTVTSGKPSFSFVDIDCFGPFGV